MIVAAASHAQRSSDFIMGIGHRVSLQECQISPEGMPLTWAREHGIDTRIPGFAHHDQDGDGVSTLIEWKHGTKPVDRLSQPPHRPYSVAMNQVTWQSWRTCASSRTFASLLREGHKRAHLYRPTWLRRPIHSILARSPRHPAPDGTNRRLDLPIHRLDSSNDQRLVRLLRPSSYLRSNTG